MLSSEKPKQLLSLKNFFGYAKQTTKETYTPDGIWLNSQVLSLLQWQKPSLVSSFLTAVNPKPNIR